MAGSVVPGPTFIPLPEVTDDLWRRPQSFGFVAQSGHVPLSDSELLLTSHHLPIAIEYRDEVARVVAVTDGRFQRAPLLGPEGQWQRPYMPIAIRCLPFRVGRTAAGQPTLEVALNLDGTTGGAGQPFHDESGKPTKEINAIIALLARHADGRVKLRSAAEKLLIADVLAPLQSTDPLKPIPGATRYMTVDPEKFGALSARRAAHLARDGFLPIDLASACLFSQRLLPRWISVCRDESRPDGSTQSINLDIDAFVRGPFELNVQVDDSELFSFEEFDQSLRTSDHDD